LRRRRIDLPAHKCGLQRIRYTEINRISG